MKKRKLTEKEKERRIDYFIDLFVDGIIILTAELIINSLVNSNNRLNEENRELKRQNANLKGRNRSLKDENRRLARENYEACYHLGKKSVTHQIRK